MSSHHPTNPHSLATSLLFSMPRRAEVISSTIRIPAFVPPSLLSLRGRISLHHQSSSPIHSHLHPVALPGPSVAHLPLPAISALPYPLLSHVHRVILPLTESVIASLHSQLLELLRAWVALAHSCITRGSSRSICGVVRNR